MAFFKFRNRGPQANEGRNANIAAPPAESVEAMRRRARHRLLGAAVLVLVGVIGFPLLFDTQPRPVSVDIPIEIPDRNKARPLQLPASAATGATSGPNAAPLNPSTATTTPSTSEPATAQAPAPGSNVGAPPLGASARPAARAREEIITETAEESDLASRPAAAAAPADTRPAAQARSDQQTNSKPEARAQAKSEPKPDVRPEHKPDARNEHKAEAKPDSKTDGKSDARTASGRPADDAARARALLEGKPPAAATAVAAASNATAKPAGASEDKDNGRFIVQVGAFAEADKAREVRQKLEKAGLKTSTSVVKTGDGERTRVRVGPFGSRAEAERAAGKVKGLSLSAAVFSL